MKIRSFVPFAATTFTIACAAGTQDPRVADPSPTPAQEKPPSTEAPSEEPSEEELTQEREAQRLAEDRARLRGHAQVEMRRLTPEVRAAAKKVAETEYADLNSALAAVLASPHREPGNPERDAARHVTETLEFFGLTPTMRVLEYGPGGGWYTEVLAPTLAAQGKLLVTTADPEGPKDSRQTFYAERLELFLEKSPEVYGKVESVIFNPDAPQLDVDEPVDMALVIRGFHGWVRQGKVDAWLEAISSTLAEGGVLGIVQHRAPEGGDPEEWASKGYVPEQWLIERVEAHGFSLDAKSEINQNEKDTKEYPEGVWTLPPTLRLGEKDREKYLEIGESDRMTLRFTKAAE